MQARTYSQRDVIGLVDQSILDDESKLRLYQKHIKSLVAFVKDHPALEWPTDSDRGDFFLARTMNIHQPEPKKGASYEYSVEGAVFLATLLSCFTVTSEPWVSFFHDKLLKGKQGTDEQANEWMNACIQFMNRIIEREFIEESNYPDGSHKLAVMKLNVESQLYRLTTYENPHIEGDRTLATIWVSVMALPEKDRRRCYETIGRRLQKIESDVQEIVDALDPIERRFYDIDVGFLKEKMNDNFPK
jgi:hypothetical protein